MDKLIEAIGQLQTEIRSLRSDVQILTHKVDDIKMRDQLSYMSTSAVNQEDAPEAPKAVAVADNVNYGRKLNESEAAYLAKLHQDQDEVAAKHDLDSGHFDDQQMPAAPKLRTYSRERTGIEKFFAWFAQDWPMKVGGFFVIAAAGWFVVYATKENLISESARVVLGYIFAVSCVAFGALRAEKERVQGNLFLVIGSAVMLIATLAGIDYEILMPVFGLFVMLVSVCFVTLISLKQESLSLTGSVIFFGAIIPIFLFGDIGINTIFIYLFVLTLGTLWVVWYTGWRSLTTLMLFVVGFYSIGYILDAYGSQVETMQNMIIAFLFSAMFYMANVSAIIRAKKVYVHDLIAALGTGLLFLVWVLNFSSAPLDMLLLLVGTLLFAVASYVIFERTEHKEPTILYAGVSTLLLAVATAQLFDGPILITAYLVESAAVIIFLLYFNQGSQSNGMRVLSSMLYFIPLFISLDYVSKLFSFLSRKNTPDYLFDLYEPTIVDMMPDLFVVFMVCVTAFSVAITILRLSDTEQQKNMIFFRIFAYIGGTYSLLLIWFVMHLFINSYDVATFVSLVIYTVVGVMFYVFGAREGYAPYKLVGGILFGIVVARVLFVEFWEMSIAMRTITSFVLGALLISTAFLRPNKQ